MKTKMPILLLLALAVTACSPAFPSTTGPSKPVATVQASSQPSHTGVTPTSEPTHQPSLAATPAATSTASSALTTVDPLTGLMVADPGLLARRPLLVKVENVPRSHRPQWGLSNADIVYEYYTEQGMTRFAAVFYGQDAKMVAPIRSGRFFDVNLVRMYKAIFAFGSAWEKVLDRLKNSEFADRLVIEGGNNCPPMCRYEPNRANLLYTDTAKLSAYATKIGVSNTQQDLSGMTFQAAAPQGGSPAEKLYFRWSTATYNRWDYDPTSGRYLRWQDQQDDPDGKHEVYTQLTDRNNKQPIGAENVVVLLMPYSYVVRNSETEVFDMDFMGIGKGYVARDGKIYPVQWQRMDRDQVVQLLGEDGQPFPLKPGVTWYEVLHTTSTITQEGQDWRFNFIKPK